MPNKSANELRDEISQVYQDMFGNTPLSVRLADIQEEADELVDYKDEDNLIEELSDLIASCFALAAEKGLSIDDLINMNVAKMALRKATKHYETHT